MWSDFFQIKHSIKMTDLLNEVDIRVKFYEYGIHYAFNNSYIHKRVQFYF